MAKHCNEVGLQSRGYFTGVAFATRLTLGNDGKKNYAVLSVFWLCCVHCDHVEGIGFDELQMGLTLGYRYTHLLPMNMRFKLDNTVEMIDPTMDYQPARCVQKFGVGRTLVCGLNRKCFRE